MNPDDVSVFLVEDDEDFRDALADCLDGAGFQVRVFADALSFYKGSLSLRPDVAVIDVNLPDESGLEVLGHVTALGVGAILLTARGTTSDRVAGYEAGADIYFVKPVDTHELIAAIRGLAAKGRRRREAVGRSAEAPASESAAAPVWLLKQRSHLLVGPDLQVVRLADQQTRLLAALALHAPNAAPRDDLLAALGHNPEFSDRQILDSAIRRLRRTVEVSAGIPLAVTTIPRVGYALRDGIVLDPN
ncbi:DNA-binding response regulator (plasmid) [Azospirillum argentinense]|uniref:DNA-binding response regulator n=1 Tax=Azospirillum argentinense TaxID=2970906 RepID=A0A4D8PYR5_9PROT|nr:response regulator transcription factor [Azospirillum argentinense]QCN99689.1 DNA-binding response regulator [Azospirillum argentinense]